MKGIILVVTGLLLCLGPIAAVQGQVTLDASQINCEQFSGAKIVDPERIGIWLNGYYHGKHADLIIDTQKLQEDTKHLIYYCVANPKMLLLDAVRKSLGVDLKAANAPAPIGQRAR
jgi:acid stress chaperone HdeB